MTAIKGISKKMEEKLERAGIRLVRGTKYLDSSSEIIADICRDTSDKNRKEWTCCCGFW